MLMMRKTIYSRFEKARINDLPRVIFPGRIITIRSVAEAEKAVSYLMSQPILGMDTETRPCFRKGQGMNPVALLQVSTLDTCFLFRLNEIGLPECLRNLLGPNDIIKIGLSWHDDYRQLSRRVDYQQGDFVELQTLAQEMGITDKALQKLYANIFGQKISKNQQLSNWEADNLSEAQKQYAATDAWACIMLYQEMQRMQKEGFDLIFVPEPEPSVVVLTPEEIEAREKRKAEKEKRKRQHKRQKEYYRKKRQKERRAKEKIKSDNESKSLSKKG